MVSAPLLPAELADWMSLVAVRAHRGSDDGDVTVIEESDPQANDDSRPRQANAIVQEQYASRRDRSPSIQAWPDIRACVRKLQTRSQNTSESCVASSE
jgi:hypothetical protein